MIKLRLAGGLGNQIFQVSSAILLANKIRSKKIYYYPDALGNYKIGRGLQVFDFFDFSKISIEFEKISSTVLKSRIAKLLSFNLPCNIFVSDNNFQCALKGENRFVYFMDGYFQTSLQQTDFDDELSLLRSSFTSVGSSSLHGCLIHIRGGDFIKIGWNQVSSRLYYKKSIEFMQKKCGFSTFKVITDDRIYAKSLLDSIGIDFSFLGGSLHEDFYLIGSHRYRILSSSTFAFWASALGDNSDSAVIAPQYWLPGIRRKIQLPNEVHIHD